MYTKQWNEATQRYDDLLHRGQPRGNNSRLARLVRSKRSYEKQVEQAEEKEDYAWTMRNKAWHSKSCRERRVWSKKDQRFIMIGGLRGKLDEYKDLYNEAHAELIYLESRLDRIKFDIGTEVSIQNEKKDLTMLQSNDIKKVERAAKRKAKKEGKYYHGGRKAKDDEE